MSETIDYSKWNLFKKMLYIENEISTVSKELNVGEGKFSYKAVGEVNVLREVKPIEFKYGVKSMPVSRRIIVEKETTTKAGNINQFIRVETTFRFINVDNPTDIIDVITYGDGVDSSDKAPGKAMTYGDKYALLKAYKIATGDDPDQNSSEEQKTKKEDKPSAQNDLKEVKPRNRATEKQLEEITKLLGDNMKWKDGMLRKYSVDDISKLTIEQASEAILVLRDFVK